MPNASGMLHFRYDSQHTYPTSFALFGICVASAFHLGYLVIYFVDFLLSWHQRKISPALTLSVEKTLVCPHTACKCSSTARSVHTSMWALFLVFFLVRLGRWGCNFTCELKSNRCRKPQSQVALKRPHVGRLRFETAPGLC